MFNCLNIIHFLNNKCKGIKPGEHSAYFSNCYNEHLESGGRNFRIYFLSALGLSKLDQLKSPNTFDPKIIQ